MKMFSILLVMVMLVCITVPALQAAPHDITAQELIKKDAHTDKTNLACASWDPRGCGN